MHGLLVRAGQRGGDLERLPVARLAHDPEDLVLPVGRSAGSQRIREDDGEDVAVGRQQARDPTRRIRRLGPRRHVVGGARCGAHRGRARGARYNRCRVVPAREQVRDADRSERDDGHDRDAAHATPLYAHAPPAAPGTGDVGIGRGTARSATGLSRHSTSAIDSSSISASVIRPIWRRARIAWRVRVFTVPSGHRIASAVSATERSAKYRSTSAVR